MITLTACGGPGSNPRLGDIGAGLKGLHGLHVRVFARGVRHVAAIAVDGRGRVWAASSGSSSHGNDAVYMIRDRGAVPQRVITGIRGPLGLQWLNGGLFVSSLDGVTRFSGLDTRGRFTERRLVLRGPVRGAENNNLVRTANGRLVMGISAVCDHCATTPRYSGAIVSFRPDGSDLRIVAGGIRAPFGLVYTGSQLYATINQRDDLGARTPGDWLAAIEPGEEWGFPSCYGQGGGQCRGVPTPIASLDKHAAAGGVAVLAGMAIVAEWNVGKVVAVDLARRSGQTRTVILGIRHPLPVLGSGTRTLLIGDWASGTIYSVSASPSALR